MSRGRGVPAEGRDGAAIRLSGANIRASHHSFYVTSQLFTSAPKVNVVCLDLFFFFSATHSCVTVGSVGEKGYSTAAPPCLVGHME